MRKVFQDNKNALSNRKTLEYKPLGVMTADIIRKEI